MEMEPKPQAKEDYFFGPWNWKSLCHFAETLNSIGDITYETLNAIEPSADEETADRRLIRASCGDRCVKLLYDGADHLVVLSCDSTIQILIVVDRGKRKIVFEAESY